MRIIYPTEDGGIAVITPSGEIPIEQVAEKDVPAGIPYLFIDETDPELFPQDRYFRGAWEADFSKPDGYGLGHDEWVRRNS